MEDLNDIIISVEAKLSQNRFDKKLLIAECFTSWYALVEGIDCVDFSESDLTDILKQNVAVYLNKYTDDPDYTFIIGWMLTVAFWYFGPALKEEDGIRFLQLAYQSNRKNSLFKWALRKPLGLKEEEIDNLKIDIHLRFDFYYDYGNFIKEYFLDGIKL
jgi:hypothetical protein